MVAVVEARLYAPLCVRTIVHDVHYLRDSTLSRQYIIRTLSPRWYIIEIVNYLGDNVLACLLHAWCSQINWTLKIFLLESEVRTIWAIQHFQNTNGPSYCLTHSYKKMKISLTQFDVSYTLTGLAPNSPLSEQCSHMVANVDSVGMKYSTIPLKCNNIEVTCPTFRLIAT